MDDRTRRKLLAAADHEEAVARQAAGAFSRADAKLTRAHEALNAAEAAFAEAREQAAEAERRASAARAAVVKYMDGQPLTVNAGVAAGDAAVSGM